MEARLLLSTAMGVDTSVLLRDPRAPVPPEAAVLFADMLKRRLAHEPMAFVLGHQGFWTLDLMVSPATLIPRADSEAIVEAALHTPAPGRVLDLGTGTGCLLLAVLSEHPAAFGVGVDLSVEAAMLAAANARANGLGNRAVFLAGGWADSLQGGFDLVLSNPPYIESAAIAGLMPEVALHEPARALDGGADGLDAYRAIVADLPRLLAPGGHAVLELGQGQATAVAALALAAGLGVTGTHADLGGVERALILRNSEKPFGERSTPG
jgi:release factor glutamine methyltransferase